MDRQEITVRGQKYTTDVDLGKAFSSSGLSPTMIADKLQDQYEASSDYDQSVFVSRDIDDIKESYSIDEYVTDIRRALPAIYSEDFIANFNKSNPEQYGKLIYQHLYDGIDKNPRLEQHFKKHYPEQFKRLVGEANRFQVQVGTDTFDRPIFANTNYNSGSLYENDLYKAKPFDDESINAAQIEYERNIRFTRGLYSAAQETIGLITDLYFTPRKGAADRFEKVGPMVGMTPQGFAKWLNKFDIINLIRDETIPITEDLTYVDIFNSKDSVTASDEATAWLAKNVPWLGLTPPPEGEEPERMFMIPGGKPFGVDLNEELLGTGISVLTGRAFVEGGKQLIRRGSRYHVKGSKGYGIDTVRLRKDIEAQRQSGGLSRFLGAIRQDGIDSSTNLIHTVKNEQLMAAGATLSVHYLGDWATKMTGQQEPGLGNLSTNFAVGILPPLAAVVIGKPIAQFTYDTIEGFAPAAFRGEFRDVMQAINEGRLPEELRGAIYGEGKLGRKTYIELGKTLQTLKKNDPETYNILFDGLNNFKEQASRLEKSLLDNNVPRDDVTRILNDIADGQSSSWSLGIFEGAKEQFKASGFVFKSKSLLNGNMSWNEHLKNTAILKNLDDSVIRAEKAYADALFSLSGNVKKLVGEGQNVPQELLNTVKFLNKKYLDIIQVPEKNATSVKLALENVYDIETRLNNKNISSNNAVEELQTVINRLDPEDKGFIAGILTERQPLYKKDFSNVIGKLDEVQKLIDSQKASVSALYTPLKSAGILNEADSLSGSVKKPKVDGAKKRQLTLLSTVFDNTNKQSTANYNKALAGQVGDAKVIGTVDIATRLVELLDQGPELGGFRGSSQVDRVLNNLSSNDPALKKLRNIYRQAGRNLDISDPDPVKEATRAQTLQDLIKEVENLSLREAIAIRSELGRVSAKALKSGDRPIAFVAGKLHRIFDQQIETDMPLDAKQNLKAANDYYRDNVAGIFFDRYSRGALRADTDDNLPFKNFFNRYILQNNVKTEDTVGRRSQYEVMFPEGSELRAQADAEIKNIMLLQIYGTETQAGMTTNKFITQLRQKIEDPKQPLFKQDEGFLDILLGGEQNATQFRKLSEDAPVFNSKGKLEGMPIERFNRQVLDSFGEDMFFDSGSMNANTKAIGLVVNDMAKLAKQRKEEAFDPFFKLLVQTSESAEKSIDVGNSLVQQILRSKGKDSINTYQGLVEAVTKYGGADEGLRFEQLLKNELVDKLFENLASRYIEVDQLGLESVNTGKLKLYLAENKELYSHVYGEDFDAIQGLANMAQMASVKGDGVLSAFGTGMNAMSDSAALSRLWGVARGVVSVRYVASEYLLRRFASKNNQVLVKILGTPGYAEAIMDAVDLNKFGTFKPRLSVKQKLFPALAGAMSADEYTPEKYEENLKALNSFYEDSRINNTDFVQGLASLIFLARNEDQRNQALEKLALEQSQVPVEQIPQATKRDVAEQLRNLGLR